ncbi:AcrR family transcriptional regulator [Cryobacterium mesophilum]|uniref:TetR family transcriptional regulator n=1 Tax=Terrimesophilobacter mesophilus TaxID=433647 RepID=A0A4V3I9P6_9MICO|nr:TetR family transcriptional regulator [Terrimesophilobacter mesophilus]MBB5633555.1 AcrR family transcriptional regulator [Terrimesophilobacter mesophilus]TFB80258.1 TetR family transcriptional regulator [Terrimesophilobacter mesophilus]
MIDASEKSEPGLRERKRRATRRAIQHAVLDLATEHGYERVTIDEISAAADVSPRTFFNYFASKEEAVLGDFPSLADLAAAEDFLTEGSGADVLSGLGRLFEAASDAIVDDRTVNQRRRVLLREHPELFAKRMSSLHLFEDELAELVRRRLAADDPMLVGEPDALARRAHLLSLVGFATMRFAYRSWIDMDDSEPLARRVRQAFEELQQTLAATVR